MSRIAILVAEDDALLRELAATVLQRDDFVVFPAGSGEEALELFRAHTIDLLLTDVQMGDGSIDGIELAERITRDRPHTKVLVMSGFPESESLATGKGFPFLKKPFTPLILRTRVREALASPSAARSERRSRKRRDG